MRMTSRAISRVVPRVRPWGAASARSACRKRSRSSRAAREQPRGGSSARQRPAQTVVLSTATSIRARSAAKVASRSAAALLPLMKKRRFLDAMPTGREVAIGAGSVPTCSLWAKSRARRPRLGRGLPAAPGDSARSVALRSARRRSEGAVDGAEGASGGVFETRVDARRDLYGDEGGPGPFRSRSCTRAGTEWLSSGRGRARKPPAQRSMWPA